MFDLRKLLFGAAPDLPADLKAAVHAWREMPAPALDEPHFHCRYVVLDIETSGPHPEDDRLLAVAALAIERGGRIVPDQAVVLRLDDAAAEASTVDRQLAAFLQFIGKSPLVTYHAPYVGGFLQKLFSQRLGLEFAPRQIDLAWLLPSVFSDRSHQPVPLDQWLLLFDAEFDGRRDVMENTLQLARLFQRLLVRATARDLDTAEKLLAESDASSFLRRSH